MKCIFTKPNGEKCKSNAMRNSRYCWTHSPEISDAEKKFCASKGGRHKLTLLNLPEIIVKDSRDIPPLLVDTIYHLRHGKMDVRLGTAIGYLSNVLLKSYEVADLEGRIEKVEKYMHMHFNMEEIDDVC